MSTAAETLERAIHTWVADPESDVVYAELVEGRWAVRMSQTVRDATTVFCNSSAQTSGFGSAGDGFGRSMVVLHRNHKVAPAETAEFRIDDFDGLPVCRLRFGRETRLYYFNLPLLHELDPRTTRYPLKIHAIYRPEGRNWSRLSALPAEQAVKDHDFLAARQRDAAEPIDKELPHHD